eukprot:snap_masked-scaffold_41-processed-gene-0.22-mRNA-1 protein AED:1.00 eAED:1.00 QI:0/-1/0/0/-1/1/1/0/311
MDTKEVLEELRNRIHTFATQESLDVGRNFKPRENDIFVTTAPKCGTTWTLQICHMLRSNGDTDYEDLLMETPWDVLAHDAEQDLDAEQKYSPRVFKSHETYANIAKGAKYIFVTRDPYDAFVSYYHFLLQSPNVNTSNCSMKAFGKIIFEDSGIFELPIQQIISYVEATKKNPEKILFLFYEDMKENPRNSIERIARFMGLDTLSEKEFQSRCNAAEKLSSLEYMRANKVKFELGEVMKRKFKNTPEFFESLKNDKFTLIRSGKKGDGKKIPREVKDLIAQSWKQLVEKQLGYTTYDEFRHNFTTNVKKFN